ncbi:MAG TPA: hypothetical protein VGB95_05675 [Chitinophagales bacterium]
MKKRSLILCVILFAVSKAKATPDSVKTGIYITSIHDIDFQKQEYTMNCWLWLKYKNPDFDFAQNLEIPQAKEVTQSFVTIDSSDGRYYVLMKLQCVMKDNWKIKNFPFDKQKLRFSIENSQYDKNDLIFVADTVGKHYDPKFTISGWEIDKFKVSTGISNYETSFGDSEDAAPHEEYSTFKVRIETSRDAMDLFWKLFLGMYVAFFIAYACCFIHIDSIDSRFGLAVGALFAVVGNKYVVESSLPESVTFTLVDILHDLTLFFILIIIVSNTYALSLLKKEKDIKMFDRTIPQILVVVYLLLNVYFISKAIQ